MRNNNSILNRVILAALASTLMVAQVPTVNVYADTFSKSIAARAADNEQIVILDSYGDLETASVEWKAVKGASGYNVYYKSSSDKESQYKLLDSELIRQYPSYFRADILGLSEGSYDVKVAAVFDNKVEDSKNAMVSKITVKNHTREGFAFSKNSSMKTGSGGYNDNGTVPEDANIIYIDSNNVNNVALDVVTSSKGDVTKCKGLVDILTKRQKGYDKSHLIIRMIGEIKGKDIKGLNSNGYLQIKGTCNVTFEGVGEDATVNNWGILIRDSKNVEIRNLGFMLFPDDGISLDTNNENIWIHNNDIFYGTAGSDADQAKGDGSCDVKGNSNYVTISYNHFWDSGKSSLCGMNDTEEFFVTYHHNWFDHSDSRHPRIRVGSVHIYNNYFDGNSKYGVGVTKGASAFVEANVFRNCKYPMMSSLQGSDIAGNSKGTFSGETGGMIKAYNNSITGGKGVIYAQNNSTQFDAYLAASRNEKVSSSYKTVSGKTTYNNFDTSAQMYDYTPDSPNETAAIVKKYSGRVNGGDFTWKFTSEDDESYKVNEGLMAKLKGYSSHIVSIGGNSIIVSGSEDETPEMPQEPEVPETPAVPEEPILPEIPELPDDSDDNVAEEIIEHNFTESGINSSYFDIKGNTGVSSVGVNYENLKLSKYLKVETATKISFETNKTKTLTLVLNSDFSKTIVIDGEKYKASKGIVTVELKAGKHTISKGDAAKLYYINLK